MPAWLYIIGGLVALAGVLTIALTRAAKRGGEWKADAGHERDQKKAIIADQERADGIARKADAARLAADAKKVGGAGGYLAERLRDSGRGRKTRD